MVERGGINIGVIVGVGELVMEMLRV